MLVVIVGNTRTHFGVPLDAGGWHVTRHVTQEGPWPHPMPGCPTGIVSVVPEASQTLLRAWEEERPVLLTSANAPLPIAYQPAGSLGADRIANAVALHARLGGAGIVVDLGTATSLTAIAADGTILGGAIAPGLDTSHAALVERTALLPPVPLEDPGVPWGGSTVESIQLGLVAGHVGLVTHLVERMRRELGAETPVLLTGGGARVLAPLLPDYDHQPDLTLEGGRLWLSHALAERTR